MSVLYRTLIPVFFWLGLLAFVIAVIMKAAGTSHFLLMNPRAFLAGAETAFLAGIAVYCVQRGSTSV